MKDAIALTDVVLLNRAEARRLAGDFDDQKLVDSFLGLGVVWVLLKRGAEGLLLGHGDEQFELAGFKVKEKDATGAGDSVAGAAIYGVLHKMPVKKLAVLANATGAAKVLKLGTGHNMPTVQEIASVLEANGYDPDEYLKL